LSTDLENSWRSFRQRFDRQLGHRRKLVRIAVIRPSKYLVGSSKFGAFYFRGTVTFGAAVNGSIPMIGNAAYRLLDILNTFSR
jgi:hypothetical protein